LSTYDMSCGQCGHTFEVYRQGFLRDEDRVCPECGSTDTRQSFTSFLARFGSSSGTASGCVPRGGFS
jgi:putative FmdB family regulatory protein